MVQLRRSGKRHSSRVSRVGDGTPSAVRSGTGRARRTQRVGQRGSTSPGGGRVEERDVVKFHLASLCQHSVEEVAEISEPFKAPVNVFVPGKDGLAPCEEAPAEEPTNKVPLTGLKRLNACRWTSPRLVDTQLRV